MGSFKVTIVGGGLAGALLANGLLKHDVNVTVYERDVQHSKREGYQIRLGDAAITAFRLCLTDQHLDVILRKLGQSTGAILTAPTLCNTKFQPVIDLSTLPSYAKSSAINRVVLRDLLLEPVNEKGAVRFGKAFQRYEIMSNDAGDEKVVVHFADGSSDECDILVGADGSASKVNKQVGANNIIDIDSHWSFVAKGDLPVKKLPELPPRLLKGPIITLSKGFSFYYSLYLPSSSNAAGQAPPASTITYDETQASYYWGLNVPKKVLPYNDISEIQDRRQACLDAIQDWAPEYHKMLEFGAKDHGSNDLSLIQLRASKRPSKNWRRTARDDANPGTGKGHPRVWLMGDAIHAMQPNRGMGGNQAMFDCYDMLPHLLTLAQSTRKDKPISTSDIQISCAKYEDVMFDRAFTWVKNSGGTSIPNIDLDGFLARFVSAIVTLALPVIRFVYMHIFHKKA